MEEDFSTSSMINILCISYIGPIFFFFVRSRGDSRIPSSISVATRISKGIITRIINKRGDITDVSLAISIYSQESRGGGGGSV